MYVSAVTESDRCPTLRPETLADRLDSPAAAQILEALRARGLGDDLELTRVRTKLEQGAADEVAPERSRRSVGVTGVQLGEGEREPLQGCPPSAAGRCRVRS